MRQIRKVIASFEHGRVHQRRESRVVVILEGCYRRLDRLGLCLQYVSL